MLKPSRCLVAVAAVLFSFSAASGFFQPYLTALDGGTQVAALQGESFPLRVTVADPCVSIGTSLVASAPGVIDVIGGSVNPPWTLPGGLWAAGLDPSWSFGPMIPPAAPPGATDVAQLWFSVDSAAAPGLYTIDFGETFILPQHGVLGMVRIASAPGVQLQVLPEPATLLLLLAALVAVPFRHD